MWIGFVVEGDEEIRVGGEEIRVGDEEEKTKGEEWTNIFFFLISSFCNFAFLVLVPPF